MTFVNDSLKPVLVEIDSDVEVLIVEATLPIGNSYDKWLRSTRN